MADRESKKEEEKQDKEVVQLDDASSSSTFSSSSIESTLTDKSDIDFPKSPDSSPSPAEDPPPNYDPTRIPSSVFSCRQAGGADWSVNSNESLFSITMGNNSFSRDHAFVVYKSGELLRLDEVFSHPTLPPPPAIESTSLIPKNQDLTIASSGAAPAVPNKATPGVKTTTMDEEQQGRKKPNSEDVGSCAASDGSGASNSSFAFPILISNKSELISELPSLRPQGQSTKSPKPQPGNAPTPKPHGYSWLSCLCCCPFRRK